MSNVVCDALLKTLSNLRPETSKMLSPAGRQVGTRAVLAHITEVKVADLTKQLAVPVHMSTSMHLSDSKDPKAPGEPVADGLDDLIGSYGINTATMGGLQSLDIFSKPKIVRLSSKANDVGVEWRYLHVNVTLKTDKVQLAGLGLIGPQTQGSWLPALPVPRLIVPIVRSAYMHIHKNFKGTSKGINLTDPDKIPGAAFWLIHPDSGVLGNLPAGIVPGDLPQVLDNAASSVNAAMDVFGALLQAGGTFSYLAGLVPLQDSIKALGQKGITTEVGEGVKQLNDYDLVLNNTSFLGIETENDIEAEDEVSALICTGAPGDYMMFYGDDSYDGDDDDDGSFRIEVGPAGFTIVNALDMKTLKTNPKGMFRQFYKPDNDTWDEEISSVRMI